MGSIFDSTSFPELRALCRAVCLLPTLDVNVPYATVIKFAKDDIPGATRRLVQLYRESTGVAEVLDSSHQVISSLTNIEQHTSLIETRHSPRPTSNQNLRKISAIQYIDKVGQYFDIDPDTEAKTYTLERVVIAAALHGELGFRLPKAFPNVRSIEEFIDSLRGVNVAIHRWFICSPDCKVEYRQMRILDPFGNFPFACNPPELSEQCRDCKHMPLFCPFKQCWFESGEQYSWRRDRSGLLQTCGYDMTANSVRFHHGMRVEGDEDPWKNYLRWKLSRRQI